jgi:hypothetical protein
VLRASLFRLLPDVFEGCGLPWTSCLHQDRGDGILTIVPATVSTMVLVDPLLTLLTTRLRRYNRQAGEPVRMQLRIALHVGPVLFDERAFPNQSLIHAVRMLDAPVLKRSLASTGADLAVMVSEHVYDTVVRQACGAVEASSFRRVRYQVKKAKITSWMHLASAAPSQPARSESDPPR